jgi:hypothetical protein
MFLSIVPFLHSKRTAAARSLVSLIESERFVAVSSEPAVELPFLGLQGLIPLRDQSREMDNTGAGDIPAACPGTLPRTGSPKELQPPPPQPWPQHLPFAIWAYIKRRCRLYKRGGYFNNDNQTSEISRT